MACYDMEELRPLLPPEQWAEFLHVIASRRRQSPGGNPVEGWGQKKTLTVMLQKTVATPEYEEQ